MLEHVERIALGEGAVAEGQLAQVGERRGRRCARASCAKNGLTSAPMKRGAARRVPEHRASAAAAEIDHAIGRAERQEATKLPLPDAGLQQRRRHRLVPRIGVQRLVQILRLLGEADRRPQIEVRLGRLRIAAPPHCVAAIDRAASGAASDERAATGGTAHERAQGRRRSSARRVASASTARGARRAVSTRTPPRPRTPGAPAGRRAPDRSTPARSPPRAPPDRRARRAARSPRLAAPPPAPAAATRRSGGQRRDTRTASAARCSGPRSPSPRLGSTRTSAACSQRRTSNGGTSPVNSTRDVDAARRRRCAGGARDRPRPGARRRCGRARRGRAASASISTSTPFHGIEVAGVGHPRRPSRSLPVERAIALERRAVGRRPTDRAARSESRLELLARAAA